MSPVYERIPLVAGPVIVDEPTCTAALHTGIHLTVGIHGELRIDIA